MSKISPFRALRLKQEFADQVAELPYDVVSTEEARALAQNRPLSFFHVSRAEIDFSSTQNPYAVEVYQKAKTNLQKLIDDKIYVSDNDESFYIYQLKFQKRVQTGLVALCAASDYESGIIKRHELTRQDKEDDRVRHIETCRAQTGLVFLAYRQSSDLKNFLYQIIDQQSCVTTLTTADGVDHKIWQVSKPAEILKIQEMVAKIKSLYIADGHHRAQAAFRVSKSENSPLAKSFMAGIFSADELCILPYFRIIKEVPLDFIEKIRSVEGFKVEAMPSIKSFEPSEPHQMGFYYQKTWYKVTALPGLIDSADPVRKLDVYLVQEHLLKPIFKIENPRTDKKIDFMGGIRGVEALKQYCDEQNALGITLYATSITEVMDVADRDQIMPPKSTWFEPKLRSGFLVHRF